MVVGDVDRWEAIWRGAEETLARLLGADDPSSDELWAELDDEESEGGES
jgi:hypothetical protein